MITIGKLEANITRHCTNRCSCCNHASPFADPYCMPLEVLERDLNGLKRLLRTNFFCLQGGEPLLHPDILELIDVACYSGISDRYGILTNGKLLPSMPDKFWSKCDKLGMEINLTVYDNLPQETLESAKSKASKFPNLKLTASRVTRFSQVLGNYPNGESFHTCRWVCCHAVHEGSFYLCPLSIFWPQRFMGLSDGIDGLRIESASESDLIQFLHRKHPLISCKRCTGEHAPSVEWHEVSNMEQWLKEATV